MKKILQLPKKRRRRGVSMLLMAATLPLLMFVCGMVIDIGKLYSHRVQAQRAADAAALAGALQSGVDKTLVVSVATDYARANGYNPSDAKNPATVTVTPQYVGATNSGVVANGLNTVRVYVERPETVYFAPIAEGLFRFMGLTNLAPQFSRRVSAAAVAVLEVKLPLSLGGPYGIADPSKSPSNTSVFGPYANYNFGDPWSTEFTQNGDDNPRNKQNDGFSDFKMTVDGNFKSADSLVHLQIFDPECYSAKGSDSFDEIRDPNSKIKEEKKKNKSGKKETTTEYSLYAPDGRFIKKVTYGDDPATDNQWVSPPGFDVDPKVWDVGDYKVRVQATDGSSENGFVLRAGPQEGLTMDDTTWNNTYGDQNGLHPENSAVPIAALDHLQMNFTKSGSVNFRLGYVDASQAGQNFSISKFDVDVGSKSIVYTCDTLPGQTFTGVLPSPGDGVWSTDTIQLPTGYKGGNWYASYAAGAGDTSSWELTGTGPKGGRVRLID